MAKQTSQEYSIVIFFGLRSFQIDRIVNGADHQSNWENEGAF